MKLVINGRFLTQNVTGVQRVAIEFVHALDKMLVDGAYEGVDVEVLVPANETQVTTLSVERTTVRPVGRLKGVLWEQLELPRHTGSAVLLCLGNTAPASRLIRRKHQTFVMVHDLSYRYFPDAYSRSFRALYTALMPLVLGRSDHVFTVSRSEASSILDVCSRYIGAERLTAVQNGGGEAAGTPVRALEGRKPMALYVGSLTKRKNADGVIATAVALARSNGFETAIVGGTAGIFGGGDRTVPDDVADKITFLGQVNDTQLLGELYSQASIFLFPSFYEASPLPPVEAMSFGCPVVSSSIPSLRERCGDAAIYCEPDDAASIVAAAQALIDDRELWASTQRRGLEFSRRYTWRAQVESVLEVMALDGGTSL